MMRYKFIFRYKTINNDLYDYPLIINHINDARAYELALLSFAEHIKYEEVALHRKFVAPEKLTIIMRKEI